jgi:aminopeptidase-like protein
VTSLVDTPPALASELESLVAELYPICRSITGDGVRATLRRLSEEIPLTTEEVPSGTSVLDWIVPPEWNIRDAYVKDATGTRVIDFRRSNLHVVSYSVPVSGHMTLEELRPHLHTLPDRPDLVPYRTAYYSESWGFCLSQRELDALPDGVYEVCIDSTLAPGSLTYGELVVPGSLDDEILVSTHVCHPSLCDDNLSGVVVSALLARELRSAGGGRHTFRFLYAPGTIGAITWLARNRSTVARVAHGLTLTCLGDDHPFTYKRTLVGDAAVDRAAEHVLSRSLPDHHVVDYFPYGYDERQFNSPGFRMPVGSLMRGRHGQFPEYHTSADNPSFVSGARMVESFELLASILGVLDSDRTLINTEPYGEPQLGARGLYESLGGRNIPDAQLVMLWLLSLSDGDHSLLDIATRAGVDFDVVDATARVLESHGLLASPTPESAEVRTSQRQRRS